MKTTKFTGGGNFYLAPTVEIVEVSIEQGFGASPFSEAGFLEDGSDSNSYDM